TPIQEAARKMAEMNIGFLVVTGGDETAPEPLGVVTDRDIVVRAVAEGLGPDTPVEEAMTPTVHVVDDSLSVEEAASLMKDKQIRRLVIRGADGELAGVVSLGDLACDGDDEELAGETLEAISEPATPVRLKG
ncbi:MAG TPA: CBS domain-containing protein, partial [Planctomycetaceae bacterium]